jgi:hypothetical protein
MTHHEPKASLEVGAILESIFRVSTAVPETHLSDARLPSADCAPESWGAGLTGGDTTAEAMRVSLTVPTPGPGIDILDAKVGKERKGGVQTVRSIFRWTPPSRHFRFSLNFTFVTSLSNPGDKAMAPKHRSVEDAYSVLGLEEVRG